MKNTSLFYCFLIGILTYTMGCSKLDSNYKQFIGDGEITYVQKADSLRVRGGDQRAEISWLLISDPRVSSYKIYWDNRQDSLTGDLKKTDEIDTIRVIVNNLEEGTHDFEVILYDEKGNSSVTTSAPGKVYGTFYKNSLLNRSIKEFRRVAAIEDAFEIVWESASPQFLFAEIKYKNIDDDSVTYISYSGTGRDTVKNIIVDSDIKIRSAFKPDSTSLDTFYTDYQTIHPTFDAYLLDKSLWENAKLSDDSYEPGYDMERLWDGEGTDVGSYFRLKTSDWSMPLWFTIDLGQRYYLEKMLVNQYQSGGWRYGYDSPRKFEVYGSNVKSTDWDDWTFLGAFESIKPSGLPYGELSDEDIAKNLEGEKYEFIEVDKSFRYLRFKTLELWQEDRAGLMLAELTLWGY